MRKIFLFLCCFCAVSPVLFAQFVVTGIVRDRISRAALAGVRIGLDGATVLSDENGFFELVHDGMQRAVFVTADGYKTERLLLKKNASAVVFPELNREPEAGKNYLKRTLNTGFFNLGKMDIGNIGEIYRSNRVEGTRLTLPLQTGGRFGKSVRLGVFLGYGFGDGRWKYGANAQFLLPTESNQWIAIDYRDDVFQTGSNRQTNGLRGARFLQNESSLAGELFPIRRDFKLNRRQEFNISYERSWNSNFSSLASLRMARQHAGMFVPFGVDRFDNEAVILAATWHFGERFFNGFSAGFWGENARPVVQLSVEAGNYTVERESRQYAHFCATVQQGVQSGFGKLNCAVETGYIAGSVAFPLLQIPRGNETCIIGDYSFTMMNYMEFAADAYAALYAGYRFDNLLLGRMPLTGMLGMRETVSLKAMAGSLRSGHGAVMALPGFTDGLGGYAEAGAGIAGILGLLSVESVWRLTDRHKPGIRNWGVRLQLLVDL